MVYGLDSSVVDMHRPSLHVAPGSPRPMCLDTLSFRTLVRHPLFDADQTRRVLRAWGRGNVDVAAFWKRLQPSAEEQEAWTPYLTTCAAESAGPP